MENNFNNLNSLAQKTKPNEEHKRTNQNKQKKTTNLDKKH